MLLIEHPQSAPFPMRDAGTGGNGCCHLGWPPGGRPRNDGDGGDVRIHGSAVPAGMHQPIGVSGDPAFGGALLREFARRTTD
ncbi:MAG: hypothetical protein JWR80_2760 [Bradyrhizobium sp.]|nr:hypothetical protein [Bradyrhizobium sp.]